MKCKEGEEIGFTKYKVPLILRHYDLRNVKIVCVRTDEIQQNVS